MNKPIDDLQDEPDVSPEELTKLILDSDRIIVTSHSFMDKTLFESALRQDIVALSESLVIMKPDYWFHCMCVGTPAIYLYKGETVLARVTNHHGKTIRCSLWQSDAPIASTENWLRWFDERQIKGPRLEVEALQALQEQGELDYERWLAAIPKELKEAWEKSFDEYSFTDTNDLRTAWKASTMSKEEQIFALLEWFGSGAGPWSGFPAYEESAQKLLLDYKIEDIVSALDFERMTTAQIEGAARLFGSWSFHTQYPHGLMKVPRTIKQALWNHVKGTKDEDKLGRAKWSFQGEEELLN